MTRKDALIIFSAAIAIAILISIFQQVPGYMDAEYYYAGAVQLSQGHGFYESFLWNYLDAPAGLPHPSHTYWMPLASLVATVGMFLTGNSSFSAARAGFIVLWALVPVFTAWLAGKWVVDVRLRRYASLLAAGMALFCGLYWQYIAITETFVLYMLLGTATLCLAFPDLTPGLGTAFDGRRSILLGLVIGLMHLSRADGLLWLLMMGVLALWRWIVDLKQNHKLRWAALISGALILVGYLLVMGAWYFRNYTLYGQLMVPGSNRMVWLTHYDQTYNYPADTITFEAWAASGWSEIIKVRLNALWMNIKNMAVVQGEIFLFPLMLLGWWQKRKNGITRFAVVMWLITLLVMSFVFPFAGSRGGYLHSGAAFQPLWWSLVPIGLVQAIEYGAKRRNWSRKQSRVVFGWGLVTLCIMFSVGILATRIIGLGPNDEPWRNSWDEAVAIDKALDDYGIKEDALLMVNNPPGLFVATGRPSIVIPNGSQQSIQGAANRYHARYLVLEKNSVSALRELYQNPRSVDGLIYIGPAASGHLFEVEP